MCDYQVDRFFSEKLSEATADRPQLKAMLDYMREDDTLYVESISRLGHSTRDSLNIIDTLTDKGVILISHKENINTDTPTGNLCSPCSPPSFSLKENSDSVRVSRSLKHRASTQAEKPIEIDWTKFGKLYGEWRVKNVTGRDFMRRMDMSANTFYRRVREYEIHNGIIEPTSA